MSPPPTIYELPPVTGNGNGGGSGSENGFQNGSEKEDTSAGGVNNMNGFRSSSSSSSSSLSFSSSGANGNGNGNGNGYGNGGNHGGIGGGSLIVRIDEEEEEEEEEQQDWDDNRYANHVIHEHDEPRDENQQHPRARGHGHHQGHHDHDHDDSYGGDDVKGANGNGNGHRNGNRHRRNSSSTSLPPSSASALASTPKFARNKKRTESQTSTTSHTSTSSSLRDQILSGLLASSPTNNNSNQPAPIIPGSDPEDADWAYTKTVPTMVLYDEEGLRLYDRITEEAGEYYYLFEAELGLIKRHGGEIAKAMGFPSKVHHGPEGQNGNGHTKENVDRDRDQDAKENGEQVEETQSKFEKEQSIGEGQERWGDANVGKWNQGVNGEEGIVHGRGPVQAGLKGKNENEHEHDHAPVAKRWDIVELGAGSLRKTSHLLRAVAATLPDAEPSPNAEEHSHTYSHTHASAQEAPVRYHALDLSHPELARTLHQLQDQNKDEFRGKIEVDGLWGDYERGIEFVKNGGLERMSGGGGRGGLDTDGVEMINVNGKSMENLAEEQREEKPISEMHSPILAANRSSNPSSPAAVRTPRSSSVPPIARRMSTSSFSSFRLDGDGDDAGDDEQAEDHQLIKGIRHSDMNLDAGEWKKPAFKAKILDLLRALKIPRWSDGHHKPANVHLLKISGALTNAVFFCSYNPSEEPTEPAMSPLLTPNIPSRSNSGAAAAASDRTPPTLLVRIYGPSTGTLISRDEELRILHTLSDRYHLGPRLEGTFSNGRIEQFFNSRALTAPELRDPLMSRSIAARLRELHSVDLKAIGFGDETELYVWKCLRDWVPHAKEVAKKLESVPEWSQWIKDFGLDRIETEVKQYKEWVEIKSNVNPSRVFSHNDTQYGNILLLDRPVHPSEPEHHKLIVIDFEYAAPNPRGFDIANHFHEWQADYHHPTQSHSLSYHQPYPTKQERDNFYRGYLAVHMDSRDGKERIFDVSRISQTKVDALDREIQVWSPGPSIFWALWGIIQAKEQIEGILSGKEDYKPDFDYLAYAMGRIEMFRTEAREVGALPPLPSSTETRDQGLQMYERDPSQEEKNEQTHPRHILFLGSSLGNFDRESAAPFLASLPLRPGSSDTLLLGLDGRPTDDAEGKTKVETAYNDPSGRTRDFIMHGLDVMKNELQNINTGKAILSPSDFTYRSRYNVKLGRHEAYYQSLRDQVLPADEDHPEIKLAKGETLNIEWSYKYSMTESLDLFENANLRVVTYWKDPNSEYKLWLLQRPPFQFPLKPGRMSSPEQIANGTMTIDNENDHKWPSVPTREEWKTLWAFWDTITLGMIPELMLHSKPIDLRHKCLFYLGHIPTFLDIHLTRLLKGKHTEPERFKNIFERGIDPCVEDPTKVHDHSVVPENDEDWPALHEILGFRDRVRQRLLSVYDDVENGELQYTRRVARTLWMTFEHEAFHAETLLYMLLQAPWTLPPPGFSTPDWYHLAKKWNDSVDQSIVLDIAATTVYLGHDDAESKDKDFLDPACWQGHEFGWDNENPQVVAEVSTFKAESLPVSNGQYLDYMKQTHIKSLPGSWVHQQEETDYFVRTLYGPVPMSVAQHWPLMASHDEIIGYAKWKGGRLPTEPELMALWRSEQGPRRSAVGANIGLKDWHPVPPTNTKMDTCGQPLYGHNGGVWEWTSTIFQPLNGFEPSEIYPGYSLDFFDDLHHVVLGGSYATLPRLAGRTSLRNFYQAKYPYVWAGGRVVYD